MRMHCGIYFTYSLRITFAVYFLAVFFLGGGLLVIQEHSLIPFIYVLELSRSHNANNSNPR